MVKQIIVVTAVLAITGFAWSSDVKQKIMRDQVSSMEALLPAELQLFERNWKIAEEIVEQGKMVWIANDSIKPHLSQADMQRIEGYVVHGDASNGEVYFYSTDGNSKVNIIAAAMFNDGKFMTAVTNMEIYDSSIISSAICVQKAKVLNLQYIKNQNVFYNTYSFFEDSTITVYLAPGSIPDYCIINGGIKTVFNRSYNVLSNDLLHKSILAYKLKQKGDVLIRSSDNSDILNEIDIAQYLIWKNRYYNQMITTRLFIFYLYYIPDEDRFVKRVLYKDKKKRR